MTHAGRAARAHAREAELRAALSGVPITQVQLIDKLGWPERRLVIKTARYMAENGDICADLTSGAPLYWVED